MYLNNLGGMIARRTWRKEFSPEKFLYHHRKQDQHHSHQQDLSFRKLLQHHHHHHIHSQFPQSNHSPNTNTPFSYPLNQGRQHHYITVPQILRCPKAPDIIKTKENKGLWSQPATFCPSVEGKQFINKETWLAARKVANPPKNKQNKIKNKQNLLRMLDCQCWNILEDRLSNWKPALFQHLIVWIPRGVISLHFYIQDGVV